MFERIRSLIRDARISRDYSRYEKELTAAHMAEADRRFDTGRLRQEADAIRQQAVLAGHRRFGSEIAAVRRESSAIEAEISRLRDEISIMTRDYRSELEELYARKKELIDANHREFAEIRTLNAELSSAYEDLDESYEDLEDAKAEVRRWHNKSKRSPWLFGNGGRKLPDRSLFGQSFGDLDAAKRQRGNAAGDIGDCKDRITSIRERRDARKLAVDRNREAIGRLFDEIAEVKKDRQQMFNLKNQGVTRRALQLRLSGCLSSHESLQARLRALESQRKALVEETGYRLGLKERGDHIEDLLTRRAQFVQQFHSEKSKAERIAHHRQLWLARHHRSGQD